MLAPSHVGILGNKKIDLIANRVTALALAT